MVLYHIDAVFLTFSNPSAQVAKPDSRYLNPSLPSCHTFDRLLDEHVYLPLFQDITHVSSLLEIWIYFVSLLYYYVIESPVNKSQLFAYISV